MISVCLPVTSSNLAVGLSDESVIAHGPLCGHEGRSPSTFRPCDYVTNKHTGGDGRPCVPHNTGRRGPFASVPPVEFNLMSQVTNHSEIPE